LNSNISIYDNRIDSTGSGSYQTHIQYRWPAVL